MSLSYKKTASDWNTTTYDVYSGGAKIGSVVKIGGGAWVSRHDTRRVKVYNTRHDAAVDMKRVHDAGQLLLEAKRFLEASND